MTTNIQITPRFIISVIIFLSICLFGPVSEISTQNNTNQKSTETLSTYKTHKNAARLQIVTIINDTDNCTFQLFYGTDPASAYVFPNTTFQFSPQNVIQLLTHNKLIIKCCSGPFLTVFLQDGGAASGTAEPGYDGPFYLAMWLSFPQINESSKVFVRYAVKKGQTGNIGIKIGKTGDYRIIAYENIKIII